MDDQTPGKYGSQDDQQSATPRWPTSGQSGPQPIHYPSPDKNKMVAIALGVIIIGVVALYLVFGHTQNAKTGNSSLPTPPHGHHVASVMALMGNRTVTYSQLSNNIEQQVAYGPNINISYYSTSNVIPSNSPIAANYLRNGRFTYLKYNGNASFLFSFLQQVNGKNVIRSTSIMVNFSSNDQRFCIAAQNHTRPTCSPSSSINSDLFGLEFLGFNGLSGDGGSIDYLGQRSFGNLSCTMINYTTVENAILGTTLSFYSCISNTYNLPLNLTETIAQNGTSAYSRLIETKITAYS